MPNLISPGISVSFTDEDFYSTSQPGTVPLIIIATAANKTAPTATGGIATGTTAANAGQAYLINGQRDLVQNFGNPLFYNSGGTPLHGYELNEYGLHCAYQYLGANSSAAILRADIDLAALIASASPPSSAATDGTYWFDPAQTSFGLFQSNGNNTPVSAWVSKTVIVVNTEDSTTVSGVVTPKTSVGNDGDFAVVVDTTSNFMFEKTSGVWNKIGSTNWLAAHPTTVRSVPSPAGLTTGNAFNINGHSIVLTSNSLTDLVNTINASGAGVTATIESSALVLRSTTGSILITSGSGTVLTSLGITAKTYAANKVVYTNDASYPTNSAAGDLWIKGTSSNNGSSYVLKVFTASTGLWSSVSTTFYPYSSTLQDGASGKDVAAIAALQPTTGTIYIGYDALTGSIEFRRYNGLNFTTLSYVASDIAPSNAPVDGALWYSDDFRVDIMVSDGTNYRGYQNYYPGTNPTGVFLTGTVPTVQVDGSALVDHDLWIDTTDLENYPKLYRYDGVATRWLLVDLTDQTSPSGIISADARQNSGVAFSGQANSGYVYNSEVISDMLLSDYLDPDAPDARTVPAGMLLFNTRYSNYNVKQWNAHYFEYGQYSDTNYTLTTYNAGGSNYVFPAILTGATGRWVTISGNRANGSPLMGRRAQRAVVVKAMAAEITSNENIRSEIFHFNLIVAPGYPELIDEMQALNSDIKNVAFIIGDSPARLGATSTDIQAWATNANNAAGNGEDGLVTADPNVAVYYPWGLGTNVDGSDIMIPPSTMALNVYAYNDQVAYPWFAPAGFNRGVVTNATSIGHLDANGEYVSVLLNQGLRDTLYLNKVNAIGYFVNRGIVVFSQQTRDPSGGSRESVNVSRLCNYLAYMFDILAKPFLFEQNTQQTRDTIATVYTKALNALMALSALDDFAVKVDSENNDAAVIDARQLYVDIAIKPTRSIEFILIPVRLTL